MTTHSFTPKIKVRKVLISQPYELIIANDLTICQVILMLIFEK